MMKMTTKFDSTLKTRPNTQSSLRSTKSLKFLNNKSPIEITPSEITFTNIEPNQIYQASVLVRNLTKDPRRIRIFQPKTSKFRCDYDMQGGIAAGLAMNLVVIFETETKGDFHDSIRLIGEENFEYELLLHAYQPKCNIIFSQFLNLGFCKLNRPNEGKIIFKNRGNTQGKVELRVDPVSNKEIKIEPSLFQIYPNNSQEVTVTYVSKENGILRVMIEVYIDGVINLQKNIEVTGTSVEFNKFLTDENGTKIDSIDFGTTYFGQRKERRSYLMNNTPEKSYFKIKFRNGILSENQNETLSLQTPNELGHEQTEKVVSCIPDEGFIDPYSQLLLKFFCKSKVDDQKEFVARRYAQKKDTEEYLPEENFSYSAFIEYGSSKEEKNVIFITGRGVCPCVKLSQTEMEFYQCPMNEKRDILVNIENHNEEVPIDYNFEKIPFFFMSPEKAILLPNQSSSFTISFLPRSLGEYNEIINLYLMNGKYRIPLKLHAISASISKRQTKTRGPEGLETDFDESKNFINEELRGNKKRKSENRLIFSSYESFKPQNALFSTLDSKTAEQFLKTFSNKSKYNRFLQDKRQERSAQKEKLILDKKLKEFEKTIKENQSNLLVLPPPPKTLKDSNLNQTLNPDEDANMEDNRNNNPPTDYGFTLGLYSKEKKLPKLKIPIKNDTLYVNKPIDRYEPIVETQSQIFNPDPTQRIKKKYPPEPKSHAEIRDCNQELTGLMLQKIYAGPVEIDFKSIYVKSKEIRTFSVRNDLRSSILVRLEVSNEELKNSNITAQVIPSSQTAGFEIEFLSKILQDFKGLVRYWINDRHIFEFKVLAKVEPVKLDLSANYLEFRFEEGNLELQTSQVLHISNKGNSPGKFHWLTSENKIFSIRPQEGEVPAQGSTDVYITYKPSGNSGNRSEEEKLRMKVDDGLEETLRCEGFVKEAKCIFKQESLELGVIPICKKEDGNYLALKNIYKNPAVYHVALDKLPPYTDVTPLKDRLLPDETKFLKIKFCCKEEKKIDTDIVLYIRGGKPVTIPFKVETIIPKVVVVEDEFDFEGVTTLGNSKSLKMTVINNSSIPATLLLDLREQENPSKEAEGIECLDIVPYKDSSSDEDSSILLSVNEKDLENDNDDMGSNKSGQEMRSIEDVEKFSENSDEEQETEKPRSRFYKFTVHPKSPQIFNLKFSPKDVKSYNLELPLTLMGYGRMDSLIRPVICKGLKPKFLLQPQLVEFKKKVITTKDKCVPSTLEITISNPDNRAISWHIDQTKLDQEKVFFFVPNEGRLDALQTSIIKAFFNPLEAQYFERAVPLYVETEPNRPYLEITLKGLGAYPKLNFDRRDLILPIVPLGIVSRCCFRIFNDGYENMALKEVIHQEMENLNLKLEYADGKTLGITKSKLKVEVSFFSNKPLSFTTRVDFLDEAGKVYSLPISGTTDNSLFTNFPYFQRHFDSEYTIEAEENKPPQLIETLNTSEDEDLKTPRPTNGNKGPRNRGTSVASNKSNRSVLGFDPISRNMLDKSCEVVMRWLNHTALNINIQNFPSDFIQYNGAHVFELINFLTGKTLACKEKIDAKWKRNDKVAALMRQYSQLLKFLKEEGALLNTIRPQYFLSFLDYNAFLKTQGHENLSFSAIKITENRFNYISQDAWITLIYQILKVYYLSRISLKSLKSLQGIPADKLLITESMVEGSNFLSQSECVILKWLEISVEVSNPTHSRRITNFSNDIKNCLGIASLMQMYVGLHSSKNLKNVKLICQSEDDVRFNAEKIILALTDIRLQTHFVSKDLFYPSQREMILFLMHLWFNLPHYLPKSGPEVFKCVLGEEVIKDIELKNSSSNKILAYWVKLEGSPDFTIEKDEVRLDPKSGPYKFKVKFFARLSKPQNARITFTNKKEGNTQAGALVFDLLSEIISRKSVQEPHYVQSKLYKMEEYKFQVKNHFLNATKEYGDFQITLLHEKISKNAESQVPIPRGQKKKPLIDNPEQTKEEEGFVVPAFFVMKDKIKIKKGETSTCIVQFLPFALETHKSHLVFCDPEVGEFQHTIIGETTLPDPILEAVKPNFTVYIDSNQKFQIPLEFRNDLMREARKYHENRLSQSGRTKEKEIYLKAMQKESLEKENIVFDVELSPENPYISYPYTFTLFDKNKNMKKATNVANNNLSSKDLSVFIKRGPSVLMEASTRDTNTLNDLGLNTLPLTFNFKNPYKDYAYTITLRNSSKTDLRIIKCTVTVHPKIVKASLELKIPINEELKQEIPIINNTDKPWNMKVSWQTPHETNGHYFTGPKDFNIKGKTTNYYTITFRPLTVGKAEARLVLTNHHTNDVFDYELIGFGEEPLALDHIVFDCVAKKQTTKVIEVPNPYKDRAVTYKVESDLINPDGPPIFRVPAGKSFKYPLTVTPSLGGLYTGSISFYEEGETNKYIWYTVLMNTDRPKAEKTYDLNTFVRKKIAFLIELSNPLKESISFEVAIEGEGLEGPIVFNLLAQQTATYELYFLPLRSFKSKGSIAFMQEKLGEIWYELNLNAEENPVIRSPTLKAELGKVEEWMVYLENPSNMYCDINYQVSNPNNFDIFPEIITVGPFESVPVKIRYIPSDLEINETGEIMFESDKIGKWQFFVFGMGLPPTKFEPKIINGALFKDLSSTITFKNPFKEAINVMISIEHANEISKEALQLLIKKPKTSISGLNILQIPFSFTPKEISEYHADIKVFMNEKIQWRYPIHAITESTAKGITYQFRTKARVPLVEEIEIGLPGLPQDTKHQNFIHEIDNIDFEMQNLIKKCFTIVDIKNTLENNNDQLKYQIKFSPMKPFKTNLDLVISKPTGGRWKFRVFLEATEPNEDDTLTVYSPLNSTRSISFKLTNRYKSFASFNAFFTPDSDPEFTVMPRSGELEPLGREGRTFVISFTPMDYGKVRRGRLIIETEELLWSYIIKGELPIYKAPSTTQSKLENRLDSRIEERMKHDYKNFLSTNIKKVNDSSIMRTTFNNEEKTFNSNKTKKL